MGSASTHSERWRPFQKTFAIGRNDWLSEERTLKCSLHLFPVRQSKQMPNNLHIFDRIISTGICEDDDLQLQKIILKHKLRTTCRDIGAYAMYMKHLITISNVKRHENNISVHNNNCNTTNIAENTVKVLYMLSKYHRLRMVLRNFNECCLKCHRDVHWFCKNEFSDIIIDETGQIFCSKTSKKEFPHIMLDVNAESYERQSDEKDRQFMVYIRIQQHDETRQAAISARLGSETESSISSKPFYTKFFPKKFREETLLDESKYYESTCRSCPKRRWIDEKRTITVKERWARLDIDCRWITFENSSLSTNF